jgi:hypothetical protein
MNFYEAEEWLTQMGCIVEQEDENLYPYCPIIRNRILIFGDKFRKQLEVSGGFPPIVEKDGKLVFAINAFRIPENGGSSESITHLEDGDEIYIFNEWNRHADRFFRNILVPCTIMATGIMAFNKFYPWEDLIDTPSSDLAFWYDARPHIKR